MEVRKIPPDCWCVACDRDMATYEICDNGNLHLAWANGAEDREICLCPKCIEELRKAIEVNVV